MTSAIFQADAILECTPMAYAEAHAEIDSTNNRALELARDAALPTPTLVVAERQSFGRGQRGRPWWSPDGALLASLVIEPPSELTDPRRRYGLVALAAATHAADAVDHLLGGASAVVKWPNDVLFGGRKLAGILLEAPHVTSASSRLVVGIGLNVNNRSADYASLADVARREFKLQQVLIALLNALLSRFDQAWHTDQTLLDSLAARCMLTGQTVNVVGDHGTIAGTCRGIADDGGLVLQTIEGLKTIRSGTVTLA